MTRGNKHTCDNDWKKIKTKAIHNPVHTMDEYCLLKQLAIIVLMYKIYKIFSNWNWFGATETD